jgi:Response regulator containing CheY-like receiver, AAA-type ATPase, and DNA-binding domains
MTIPYGPVLVAEDIPNILELLEVTLTFKGYTVVTAHNGLEALELIEREKPALVITDILMPKMDGYALAHKLRTNPLTRHIPIIFLSATYVTPQDKAFALSLGAVRFLEKPVDTEEFLLTVAEVLTSGQSTIPMPLSERDFNQGYRQRLESKLLHKNTQIVRTERLLTSLPLEQKSSFKALPAEAISQRAEIQTELDELFLLLEKLDERPKTKI